MAPEAVSNDLCLARMDAGRTKFDGIEKALAEIAANTKGLPVLAQQVKEHEDFLKSLKRYGVWILAALAIAAVSGTAVSVKDLLKP